MSATEVKPTPGAATEALLAATRAVLAERERELLELKGPCRLQTCRLHRAHAGPCDVQHVTETAEDVLQVTAMGDSGPQPEAIAVSGEPRTFATGGVVRGEWTGPLHLNPMLGVSEYDIHRAQGAQIAEDD